MAYILLYEECEFARPKPTGHKYIKTTTSRRKLEMNICGSEEAMNCNPCMWYKSRDDHDNVAMHTGNQPAIHPG